MAKTRLIYTKQLNASSNSKDSVITEKSLHFNFEKYKPHSDQPLIKAQHFADLIKEHLSKNGEVFFGIGMGNQEIKWAVTNANVIVSVSYSNQANKLDLCVTGRDPKKVSNFMVFAEKTLKEI